MPGILGDVYLRHILDATHKIEGCVSGIDEDGFSRSSLVQDAIIRQLEMVGEAVKRLSRRLQTEYPEVPRQDMAGMRDKLIHDCFGVDLKAVWLTATDDIPKLKEEVVSILEIL